MKKLTIPFGSWIFSPGLASSLAILLLIPLLVYLGFWQLHRADEKQKMQQELGSRMNEPALVLLPSEVLPHPRLLRYRSLQVTGTFLNQYPILLDNQILEGKVGYRVITPFLPIGGHQILLVDRGWIPLGKNRTELPLIPPLPGKILLTGTLNLPSSGLQLKQSSMDQISWPLRVQRIDFQELSTLFALELYPFILQLNPKDPNGFNIPPITLNTPATRHLGYAIQWFAMAIAAFIYYWIINCRPRNP